jgi:ribosomal protein S18 acetylase RimI-like enzyme
MDSRVRPARPQDRTGPELLYVSAAPYYDAYAGSRRRAVRTLQAIWCKPGHTASHEVCHVAELDGAVAGILAAFPSAEGDRLARRFLMLSLVRLPAWRWLAVLRHLRASTAVMPIPPAKALYVDALAVGEPFRRRGVATALLEAAERLAHDRGLRGVALDTGLDNVQARALYEGAGFETGAVHPAPNERIARAVGGPGFISYFKPV